ncbi:MAG TPA: TIGR01777 family oxidoreductase [Microthrixaceae bacterium]|nr:TIGR01777 family oxidoreductase [Microthrixaceae bacterium]
MRVAVSGSTGLIGTRLVRDLRAEGHEVLALARPGSAVAPGTTPVAWDPVRETIDGEALEGLDAVVHLAGAGIGDARWTEDRKRLIMGSRVDGTTLLSSAIAKLRRPPAVLLSASGVGYYGDTGDRITDESGPAGDDFTADVCQAWEAATAPAEQAGVRVAHLRSGVVLATEGGALARQLPFFRAGLGGRSGSGRQYLSWISLHDETRAIRFLLEADLSGPVNLVAPEPVTNSEYARTLGRVLRRPTTIIPMFGPRLLFGRELADSLLLTSQRIVPGKLTEAGFGFTHPRLEVALREILG